MLHFGLDARNMQMVLSQVHATNHPVHFRRPPARLMFIKQ